MRVPKHARGFLTVKRNARVTRGWRLTMYRWASGIGSPPILQLLCFESGVALVVVAAVDALHEHLAAMPSLFSSVMAVLGGLVFRLERFELHLLIGFRRIVRDQLGIDEGFPVFRFFLLLACRQLPERVDDDGQGEENRKNDAGERS